MTCTLTAVPYASAATATRANAFQNPRGMGVLSWSYYVGAGGSGSLSSQPLSAPAIGRDGAVLPAQRLYYQQSTASTAAGGLYWRQPVGSLTPGATYTASIYAAAAPTQDMRATIVWFNAAGSALGSIGGPVRSVGGAATGYERLSVTGVAPAGASFAEVSFYAIAAIPSGTVLAYTAALFEASATLLPWFDGSTLGPVGSFDAWSSVPHQSFSVRSTRTIAPAGSIQSTPALVLDYSSPRESRSTEHRIIGRPDPVHALGPLGARSGSLEFFYPTHALAVAAQQLHTAARVMLRDTENPGMDMYYVPRSADVAPHAVADEQWWRLTVDYTEVYATAGLY